MSSLHERKTLSRCEAEESMTCVVLTGDLSGKTVLMVLQAYGVGKKKSRVRTLDLAEKTGEVPI